MNLCKIVDGEHVCNPNRDHMHDECKFYSKCTTCESTMHCPICDYKTHKYCSNQNAMTAADKDGR